MTPPAPGDPPSHLLFTTSFTLDDLPHLRLLIEFFAAQSGLAELMRAEFVVAVDAVATSAIEHGDGGTLRLRQSDGRLECQVGDSGPVCAVENVSSRANECGKSLWGCGFGLVSRLTDRLSVSASANGATVTLSVNLPC
ncbi:ATP-binding protein [Streptomyces sclerotialus]|uniref:ATP-binding protein n=1 Tax=Streptomyces sclerotialus TaxID=1957 RepID=UPI00068A9559